MNQALENLVLATETRIHRAVLKEDLRAGRVTLHEAMQKDYVQTMKVEKLLLALPGIGPKMAERHMKSMTIGRFTAVKDLSEVRRRQLEELVG